MTLDRKRQRKRPHGEDPFLWLYFCDSTRKGRKRKQTVMSKKRWSLPTQEGNLCVTPMILEKSFLFLGVDTEKDKIFSYSLTWKWWLGLQTLCVCETLHHWRECLFFSFRQNQRLWAIITYERAWVWFICSWNLLWNSFCWTTTSSSSDGIILSNNSASFSFDVCFWCVCSLRLSLSFSCQSQWRNKYAFAFKQSRHKLRAVDVIEKVPQTK